MECDCIRYRDVPRTTRLFSAFTDDFSSVGDFYGHSPDEAGVRAAANEVQLDVSIRRTVAEILSKQNLAFGAGEAVARNIERLAEGAVAIVTGQQVGLFGGPAYCFYKALAAIEWAGRLTRGGIEAVPIFWLATEDHDLVEVSHVFLHGKQGMSKIELPPDEAFTGHSVGRIPLGETIGMAVSHAAQFLDGPETESVTKALEVAYSTQETFSTAFAKLFARLFGERGLILLDPLDRRLHELALPVYRRAVEGSQSITEEILARDKLLDRRGFHAQVKVNLESALLFLEMDGKRQAVRRRNSDFLVGRRKFSQAELVREIEDHPEYVSASVLLRPIVQDSLLPTAAYIGGPAEVAYMAQAQVVYNRILGRMPAILSRPSFTLVEPEAARLLNRYALEFREVLRGRQHIRRKMEREYIPRGLAARFARDEKSLRKSLQGLAKPLTRLDKSLLGSLTTAERKMLHQFEKLRMKAGRAHDFRSGVLGRHERELLDSLFPQRGLQERSLSLLPFLSRHSSELYSLLTSAMKNPCPGHRVVFL